MKKLYILLICLFSLSFGTLQAQNTSDCMCTEEYDPVCGADGITYGNFCFSTCENIEISYFGACIEQPITATAGENYSTTVNLGPDTSPVDGPSLFLWSAPDWAEASVSSYDPNNTLAMNDNILYIDGTPTSNDIGSNYFVIYAQSAWSGDYSVYDTIIVNVLSADDCYCYMMYSPVCGEDGQTYGNICEAGCEDVAVAYEGECEEITPCLGDFDIIEQEYIAGFAGMMLHLQVQNTGNDLSTTMASVILANTCASNDIFTFDTWASGDIVNMYFNYSCLSMAPYIEPFEAILVLSGTTNCAQDISFVFDPQGSNSSEGCTDSDGIFYNEGSSWNIDDCTFCSCFNGEIICAIADCAMPPCEDPIFIEGQCCPICEEEIFGCTNPIAVNYNPEANIDDNSCELDPNSTSCSYYGETLELGETMTINGELCTCQEFIAFPWSFDGGAQMFCVPLTDTLGCSSDAGDFYPLGAFMEGECETCQCVDQGIIANNPYWECYEIADCGVCSEIECAPGFYCENGECLPEIDLMGCTADNGETYPIGYAMEGDCETCFCMPSIATSPLEGGEWICEEITGCGENDVYGCLDPIAINNNLLVTIDDGSCEYGEFDCSCCIESIVTCPDEYCAGTTDCYTILDVFGCTNYMALNYNQEATNDDGSCEFNQDCGDWGELVTINVNGEFPSNYTGWDLSGTYFSFGGGLTQLCLWDGCYQFGMYSGNPESWEATSVLITDVNGAELLDLENGFIGSASFGLNNEEECNTQTYSIPGCIDQNALNYNPEANYNWGCIYDGCYLPNNVFIPLGESLIEDCESCYCNEQALFPNGMISTPWVECDEIADCGDCSLIDCEPGFYCENGECLPETDLMGCTADNGEVYPIGSVLEGECETCICTPSMLTVFPAPAPSWFCEEIADCGEPTDCETVYMNMSAVNDYYESWYPGMTYSIIDANGTVIASGANVDESSIDTLCLPASCDYQVMMEGISPYGGCELAIWTLSNQSGEELATNITCDEYWANNNMTYYVDFEIGCSIDCECPLDVWDPVCAENGETYAYSCFAECLDLEYEMGECSTLPDTTCICPMYYNPVCGSNGITYSNECFAECAGVEFYEGECLPTSFCDAIEVETETIYTDNGDVQLIVTVYNNSSNDINYPVFSVETDNDYVTIEPLFENAYWLGAGESTTNSYTLTGGGNAAEFVEGTYYVSQLNQNAACAYPISFAYEPIWSGIGCYANGVVYPMGSTLTSDCETCYCPEVGDATVIPTWECTEIEDCETDDPCNLIDCADGYECVNGDCISIEPQEFGCTEGDQWYEFGSVIDQECNTCTCMPGFNPNAEGFWMCTMMPCEEEYGCELDGELYEFGSSIEQGCNMCYCEAGFNPNANGIWSCTEMACGGCTDPEAINYDEYAVEDNGSCEYETDATPNWDYLNTGSNHTLVLAEDMLVELDGTSLEPGDWIGVFYTLNGELVSGGYTVWDGGTTVIPSQGDDATTDIQDGFNNNQEFQWLVWDASANTIYSMDATYDTTMPNQQLYATNGISAILTLTAQPLISEQELQLVEGWNLFSTYMLADVMDAEELFASFVEDVVIVKNYVGLAYLPSYNFNGIGDLLAGQGYQIKLNNANNLTIAGDYLTPEDNPIDLVNGWNLVAYLRTEPADVIAVFEDIQELVIVKDNIGMAYLPEYGFNGIGNMVSGQAYQIKVLLEQQLQYLANNQSYKLEMTAVENNLQHYKTPQNTGSNMSLVIEATQLESLLSFGDEVAVYSNSNRLVGAFVYQDQNIVIPVYGNDDYFKEQNGLLTNEALTLKYWSNEKGEEIPLNINWDSSTGLYEQNSIQVASIENANSAFSKIDFEITPNPATHSAALNFDLREKSQVEIQVFNILGDLVFNKGTIEFNKGENRVNLNVADYLVGTYLIKLQTNSSVYTKRLLVQ